MCELSTHILIFLYWLFSTHCLANGEGDYIKLAFLEVCLSAFRADCPVFPFLFLFVYVLSFIFYPLVMNTLECCGFAFF